MTARSVLRRTTLARMMVVGALMAAVVVGTGAAASATPGIDPFQPIATGPTGSSGGSSSPTTTPTTTATLGGGSSTAGGSSSAGGTAGSGPTGSGATGAGAATSSQGAPAGTTGSLPFTGSHTMATFLLGLVAILFGVPLARAGRRWFDARHWPTC